MFHHPSKCLRLSNGAELSLKATFFVLTKASKNTPQLQNKHCYLVLYGSDLSYVRLFEQIQLAINYLSSIKKLCDAIEIPEDQGSRAIQRMEKNIDNKDSLLQIISETYASADSYLKDNDRGNTATLVILGGWIESLYIATQIADYANPSNKEIVDRMANKNTLLVI
jgi:hypothetical protein